MNPKKTEIQEKKARRGCSPVKAINPLDGQEWEVFVSAEKVTKTGKKGLGASNELIHGVRHVLAKPKAIFRGIRDRDEVDWLCYCGIPPKAYDYKTGEAKPPWPNEVFLVFVNYPDRIVYHWSWHTADLRNKDLPEGYDDRFDERAL